MSVILKNIDITNNQKSLMYLKSFSFRLIANPTKIVSNCAYQLLVVCGSPMIGICPCAICFKTVQHLMNLTSIAQAVILIAQKQLVIFECLFT